MYEQMQEAENRWVKNEGMDMGFIEMFQIFRAMKEKYTRYLVARCCLQCGVGQWFSDVFLI